MNHPFLNLSPKTRNRLTLLFIFLALLMTAVMNYVGGPLANKYAPLGIVSFEFAGDWQTAHIMVASWNGRQQTLAGISLGLDFLYPTIYALAISSACIAVAALWQSRSHKVAQIGISLSWGVWLAAIFDYVENYALIQLLLGTDTVWWAPIAYLCATIKFLLIFIGILYALIAFVIAKISPQSKPVV